MRVLITGGTGLVGSHITRTLSAQGHDVRLLVRNAEKAGRFYSRFSITQPELFVGDVTDASSVEKSLRDCNAVVHAAAGTPMQTDSIDSLFAVNVGGVKNVVGAANSLGLQHIICISSITAIFNEDGSKITSDSPPVRSSMPYGQSKVEAELYMRKCQSEGVPIAILYPGGIIGPDAPALSDSCKAIKHRVEQGFRIFGDGGMQYIDVRDLAEFVSSLLSDGGHGRFLLPGVFSTWVEQANIIEQVSGATLNRIDAQGWKLRLIGKLIDVARRFKNIDTPISAETMRYATLWPRIANTEELERRGLQYRAISQSFDDTLRWMVEEGHLDVSLCPNYKSA